MNRYLFCKSYRIRCAAEKLPVQVTEEMIRNAVRMLRFCLSSPVEYPSPEQDS